MNISINHFETHPSSICHHNHYYSAGRSIREKFRPFNRLDPPVLCREPAEMEGFYQAETKAFEFPCTVSVGSTATKVNSGVSSDVSCHSKSKLLPMPSRTSDNNKLLHRACQLFPNSPEIIRSALLGDDKAIRRREKMTLIFNHSASKRRLQWRCSNVEPYTLPINIALRHKAGLRVLKILVDAGADTIGLTDGHESSTSLIIALKTSPRNLPIIGLLLYSNNECAMVSDRKKNYPLHIACLRGSSLEVVRHLHQVYPAALSMKNVNGETPLDIAERSSLCPEDVINFLQSKTFLNCTVEDV